MNIFAAIYLLLLSVLFKFVIYFLSSLLLTWVDCTFNIFAPYKTVNNKKGLFYFMHETAYHCISELSQAPTVQMYGASWFEAAQFLYIKKNLIYQQKTVKHALILNRIFPKPLQHWEWMASCHSPQLQSWLTVKSYSCSLTVLVSIYLQCVVKIETEHFVPSFCTLFPTQSGTSLSQTLFSHYSAPLLLCSTQKPPQQVSMPVCYS